MKDLKDLTDKEIQTRGNALLNKDNAVDPNTLNTECRRENLAILLAYQKILETIFSESLKLYKDSIDVADFDGTYKVGNHKVTFKVEPSYVGKALGITNKKLKKDYHIADSIIAIETKEMVSLKKDKLYEAYVAQIPEVLDAIRDGKLSQPTLIKTKTSSVK